MCPNSRRSGGPRRGLPRHGLLLLTGPALPSLGQRFALVFIAGAMGSIQAGDPIWFHLPWDYAAGALVYEFGSWTLLGGVLSD